MKKHKTLLPCLFEVIREMRKKWVGKGRGKKMINCLVGVKMGGKRNGPGGIFRLTYFIFFQLKLGRKEENNTIKKIKPQNEPHFPSFYF